MWYLAGRAGDAGEFRSAFGGAWVSPVFLLILLFSMLKQSCDSCLKRNLKGTEHERL